VLARKLGGKKGIIPLNSNPILSFVRHIFQVLSLILALAILFQQIINLVFDARPLPSAALIALIVKSNHRHSNLITLSPVMRNHIFIHQKPIPATILEPALGRQQNLAFQVRHPVNLIIRIDDICCQNQFFIINGRVRFI
jgi:hypothetical protein